MTSPIPLRERLTRVFVANRNTYPPDEHSSEWEACRSLADDAVETFVGWLREQAAELRAEPFEIPVGVVGRATEIMIEQTAKYLEDVLAAAIDWEVNNGR